MHGCLGNMWWSPTGTPTGLVACCNSFSSECFMYLSFSSLVFLSLSSIHILWNQVSYSFFFFYILRTSDRVNFERPPARQMVVHGRALVFFVFKFHFQTHFAFRSECDGEFLRVSVDSEIRFSPRPRCLGSSKYLCIIIKSYPPQSG